MLLFADGFDPYSTNADIATRTAFLDPGVTAITGRTGSGKGLRASPGTQGVQASWIFSPTTSTVIIGFAIGTTANQPPPFGIMPEYQLQAAGSPLFTIRQPDLAALTFFDDTVSDPFSHPTTGLIGSAPFSNWASYVEVKLTTGHVKVQIDGVTVLDVNGAFGGSVADTLRWATQQANGAATAVPFIDDLYACDTAGSDNNDFLGNTRIIAAQPTGDGANTGWTPSTGSSHYAMVNALNGDTDYNSSATVGQIDTLTYPPIPGVPTIRAVQVVTFARTDAGGADKLNGVARIAGANYTGPRGDEAVPASYRGIATIFERNPATSAIWTPSQVNAAEFGQERTV